MTTKDIIELEVPHINSVGSCAGYLRGSKQQRYNTVAKRRDFLESVPAHKLLLTMYYVYILQRKANGQFYIGYTPDFKKRLVEHNEGKVQSTAPYIPYELIYFESYRDKRDALKREKRLKHHGQGFRRLKERLQNSVLPLQ